MGKLNQDIAKIDAQLADPTIFMRDAAKARAPAKHGPMPHGSWKRRKKTGSRPAANTKWRTPD